MTTPLARLAPKTLVPNGEGFGGFLKLEQCDVAYALAGLPHGAACLLRAMYAGDTGERNLRDLKTWAWIQAAGLAVSGKWQVPKRQELLRGLSGCAVDAMVYPRRLMCAYCGGTGSVQPNQHNPVGDCAPCGKSGRVNAEAEIATIAGITADDWHHVWRGRYSAICSMLMNWEQAGVRHVRERLNDA